MPSPYWISFILLGFIFFGACVFSLPSSMVGHFVPVNGLEERPASFSPLLIRQAALRATWGMENASFLRARYAAANASQEEIASFREQLGVQRSNLLHAHLNGALLDVQKTDYLVGLFPAMLIRVRIVYQHARDRGILMDSFESRYASLQHTISSLEQAQSALREEAVRISKAHSESREDIESLHALSSQQLSGVAAWLSQYKLFLHDVLQLE